MSKNSKVSPNKDIKNMFFSNEQINSITENIIRLGSKISDDFVAITNKAASFGWFISPFYDGERSSYSDFGELIKSLKDTNEDEFDNFLAGFFEQKMNDFASELTRENPDWDEIIDKAIYEHQKCGKSGYIASIPLFIIISDGIATEITKRTTIYSKKSAFQIDKDKYKYVINNSLDNKNNLHELLFPWNYTSINDIRNNYLFLSENKRSGESKKHNTLNRHEVMHGLNINYHNKINSLKSFSFACYIGIHYKKLIENWIE